MGFLTNFELERLCKFYGLQVNCVLTKDLLPKKLKDGGYIINLQDSDDGDGTHWTAFYVKDKELFYFDSYGCICPTEVITFSKKRKGMRVCFNNYIIQDLASTSCGFFCVAFLCLMQRNDFHDLHKSMNYYCNQFADDTKQNDSILQGFFSSTKSKFSLINKFIIE